MRYFAFTVAAAFCLVAIAGTWLGWALPIRLIAIFAAGMFLTWGFYDVYSKQEQEPIVLDDEKKATIKRLKSEGKTHVAVQQVQLWFRNCSQEEAARIVREV
ncbi:hypothetical protein JKI95_09490 [Corynebacterium aquatimens]|uniref:hypothetical protein n=1 Tax=Corynebacterium TaxID=1716 RepID=UPI001F3E511A|nr:MULTISPECIES: hypothetical protein [Corynebacterium]QYH19347.1 hypothetical protein JKI95_09490 [Corynebacterium aquatimens]UIZ91747.1 hypothetical protein JZY91_08415 [Corynebacterium sp. CNCTC7651]